MVTKIISKIIYGEFGKALSEDSTLLKFVNPVPNK